MSNYEIMLTLAQIKKVKVKGRRCNENDINIEKNRVYNYLMANPDIEFDWIAYDKKIEIEDSKPDPTYYFICGKCGRECSSTKPYYLFKKFPEKYICKDCRNPKTL